MMNSFIYSALGALMLISPQAEQAQFDQITLRESDVVAIKLHAEVNSNFRAYRSQIEAIEPVIVRDEIEKPTQQDIEVTRNEVIKIKQAVQVQTITTPTAPVELEPLVERYAAQYGANKDIMLHIMKCESGSNPAAISPSGAYVGLFQFVTSTWTSNRTAMGLDPNPALRANAEEAIKTAAFKMGRDGYGAWPACSQKALGQLSAVTH